MEETGAKRKQVVIVAPHFPPSNLAAVHRSRLFANHLHEFGFHATVLSVQPRYYEEPPDPELERLLPDDLQVIRTPALPTRPVRLVGDLGIRSFWHHYRELCRLARSPGFDLLFLPIPPNYSSLLGPLIKRKFGIPYVIDYIDPWIYPITEAEKRSWKARWSHRLARKFEPIAINSADGITGVSEAYYEGVLQRHPHLRQLPTAGIPYGGEPADHSFIENSHRASKLLESLGLKDKKVLVYAGAMLPRAEEPLRALLAGVRKLKESEPLLAGSLHLLFIGTGANPGDPGSGLVRPIALEMGCGEWVCEIANRQSYLEVLATLHEAHAVMVIGSTERHYTASKTFQAMLSRKPILAILHEASTAAGFLQDQPGVRLTTISEGESVTQWMPRIADSIGWALQLPSGCEFRRNGALESFSAREMTRRLAQLFDRVLHRVATSETSAITPPLR